MDPLNYYFYVENIFTYWKDFKKLETLETFLKDWKTNNLLAIFENFMKA